MNKKVREQIENECKKVYGTNDGYTIGLAALVGEYGYTVAMERAKVLVEEIKAICNVIEPKSKHGTIGAETAIALRAALAEFNKLTKEDE